MVRIAECWGQNLTGDGKSVAPSRDIYGMSEEAKSFETSVAALYWAPVVAGTLVESHLEELRLPEKRPAWT